MNAIFGLGTDIGSMGMTGVFDKKPTTTTTTKSLTTEQHKALRK